MPCPCKSLQRIKTPCHCSPVPSLSQQVSQFCRKVPSFPKRANPFSHSHPSVSGALTADFHHLAFTTSHSIPWLAGQAWMWVLVGLWCTDCPQCGTGGWWCTWKLLQSSREGFPRAAKCRTKCMFIQVTELCPVFPLDSLLSNTFTYSQRQVQFPKRSQCLCYSHENWIFWKIIWF